MIDLKRIQHEPLTVQATATALYADDTPLRIVGTLMDVSARKQTEQELTDTYKSLLDASRVKPERSCVPVIVKNIRLITKASLISLPKSITSLSLEDTSGRVQRVPIVKGTIALPPGDYAVADVQVTGGWRYHSEHTGPWFTHSAEAPVRLSLGAPLQGKVRIVPSGRRIDLNYSVVDAEGRVYAGRTPQPPRVEIYAGERLLDSGTFRYG